MNVYVLPTGPNQFPKSYFEGEKIAFRPYDGGSPNSLFWDEFFALCLKRGICVKSYLDWNSGDVKQDDVLLVLNHPGETFFWRLYYYIKYPKIRGGFLLERRRFFFKNYKFFKRRVLMQLEPLVAMPYAYNHLDKLVAQGLYDKVFCTTRIESRDVEYFNYYEHRTRDVASAYFDAPKTKYIAFVNSNVRPHSLKGELYGERLKSIKFFSQFDDFDMYGFYWDLPVRHPFYFHYGKYVKKSWRGKIPDKLKTLSQYKFALVFENGAYPGWVSEKIFDSFAAGVVPVYLGAPDIEKSVPADCFIDFRKFGGYAELDEFLRNMPEKKLAEYRNRIRNFLRRPPAADKMERFVNEVVR